MVKRNEKGGAIVKHATAHAGVSHEPVGMLTQDELPRAIGTLFELNNYAVEYSKNINGAEVDIVASQKGNPFAATIYIEATVQYVDNTKYGKDLTKFSLVQRLDPGCVCLSVSTSGFTADVKERASQTGIRTKTYSELFREFETFSPYVARILESQSLRSLMDVYEPPYFRDSKGEEIAISWLSEWKASSDPTANWLVVLGEYGTGKTALTLKLQYEWLRCYERDPSQPIPIRIELRNFTRQFDASSLVHHFLDKNDLSHIPIEFFFHLIRSRRVLLILDGYDEMAQFLNARERRACLAALADLSSDGAKGILTSRPNYFTEKEELSVFEALYTSLEQNKYYMSQLDRLYVAEERSVDALLEKYLLNRNERYLRDLTPEQTRALVRRKLKEDEAGEKLILGLLERIFREESGGGKQSLSGKPVIISYLLELIDELRSAPADANGEGNSTEALTEWQIYKLIVDRLMMRDLQRSPTLPPDARRQALQQIAISLSRKEISVATEETFISIIDDIFKADLRKLTSEDRRTRLDDLFQDLRSSATLTRSESAGPAGWVFSHSSLREYLVSEAAVGSVVKRSPMDITFPVSGAMRTFVSSLSKKNADVYLAALRDAWVNRTKSYLGAYVTLSFELLRMRNSDLLDSLKQVFGKDGDGNIDFSGVVLKDIGFKASDFSGQSLGLNVIGSSLVDLQFDGVDLGKGDFSNSTLDGVKFTGCDMRQCNFSSSLLFECDLTGSNLVGADFRGIDLDSNFIVRLAGSVLALNSYAAVGYLKFHGAITDSVEPYFELQHHPRFSIVQKICEHVAEQKNSQLRGLTQRGVAQNDPPFARAFIEKLKNSGLIVVGRNDLVSATNEGRKQLPRLISHNEMPECIEDFLRNSH